MSRSGTRHRPDSKRRQFVIIRSASASGSASGRLLSSSSAGTPVIVLDFIVIKLVWALPLGARAPGCSLLGQSGWLTIGQPFGEIPQFPVQPDVLIEAGDRPRPRIPPPVGAGAGEVALSTLQKILLNPVEDVPEV